MCLRARAYPCTSERVHEQSTCSDRPVKKRGNCFRAHARCWVSSDDGRVRADAHFQHSNTAAGDAKITWRHMACADAIKRLCTCFHRTTTVTTAKPRQKTKSFPATQETQTYHESRRCCRGTPAAGSRRERKGTGRTWVHIGVWFMALACRTRHSPVATPQIRQNPCGLTAQSSAHGGKIKRCTSRAAYVYLPVQLALH